jgi:hypothetical protein
MKTITMLLMAVCSIIITTAFSQEKAGKKDTAKHTTYYTCPMHDSILATKPGYCPICGMKLQLTKKEQMKNEAVKIYTCPMHSDVTRSIPGQCPKCGSSLVSNLSAREKMKMQTMKSYTCPMHPDEFSGKPGYCPKCGMALAKVKSKDRD